MEEASVLIESVMISFVIGGFLGAFVAVHFTRRRW